MNLIKKVDRVFKDFARFIHRTVRRLKGRSYNRWQKEKELVLIKSKNFWRVPNMLFTRLEIIRMRDKEKIKQVVFGRMEVTAI